MIDVLAVYQFCGDCNHPDFSDDDDDDNEYQNTVAEKAHWSPIVIRKLWGSRRLRADTVRYVFKNPKSMLECDNVQVECTGFGNNPHDIMRFKRYDMWSLFRNKIRSDTVIVAVEV